jgi:hypothetical protein
MSLPLPSAHATGENYDGLRAAIKAGNIKPFQDIFTYVDQRSLFKAAGLNPYGPAIKRVNDPGLFKIEEVYALARAIGVSGLQMLKILSGPG